MVEGLQLLRTNPNHYGTGEIKSLTGSVNQGQDVQSGIANRKSFDSYLIDALSYVNDKQVFQSNISEQAIIDPESVDVHDVTIAMAEANLSLTLANTVISRITQAWTEITTTR